MQAKIIRTLILFFSVLLISLVLSYYQIKPFLFFDKGMSLGLVIAAVSLYLLLDAIFSFFIKKK